jgi:hypothetical protein
VGSRYERRKDKRTCYFFVQDRKAGCLFGLLYDPEDRGSTFFGNVVGILPDNTASQSRR